MKPTAKLAREFDLILVIAICNVFNHTWKVGCQDTATPRSIQDTTGRFGPSFLRQNLHFAFLGQNGQRKGEKIYAHQDP